ncbi:MAG: helix-turn-helix domain-containing protein [Flavonifractor plautii]|nr:helix-turn-helix domain-containing protein [Flavonifractor plautii]
MSYFSEIYGDPELSARAKQVLVYLHDRANKDGKSWYAIATMAKEIPGEQRVYFELLSNKAIDAHLM